MAENNQDGFDSYPFFHGNISREEAERLLKPLYNAEPGLFLIRYNQHYEGELSLSLLYKPSETESKCAVEHYRIQRHKDTHEFTIDEEEYFKNLDNLVKHYTADADGLVSKLTRCVPKEVQISIAPGLEIPKEKLIMVQISIAPGLEIPKEKLIMGELIGKGNFSEVYEATYNGMVVAAKVLKDKSAAKEYLLEVNVMATLHHPNLVNLLGVVVGESLIIVTEYMAKGSLLDYLRSRGRTAITPTELLTFAKDICVGMEYLESKNIVHRDLAARNVLIHEDGTSKVADFGLARTLDDTNEKQPEGKIAIRWTAPEACLQKEFSSKSDVWSFGILLWEIYSFGRVPYPRTLLGQVVETLKTGYRMDPPAGCPTKIHNIMKRTWQESPENRPSFKELLAELSNITPD